MNKRTQALTLLKVLQEEQEEFIFGLSDNNEKSTIETNNYFEIIRDKNTGRYYYTIDIDTEKTKEIKEKLLNIYKEFVKLVINDFENVSFVATISNLNHIYDIDALTSANSLDELFIRFMYVIMSIEDLLLLWGKVI